MKRHWQYPLAILTTFGIGIGLAGTAMADTAGQNTSSATSTSSSSSPTITQQQAVDTATKLLSIPSGYSMTGATLQQNWGAYSQPVYSLNWQGPQLRSAGPQVSSPMPAYAGAVVDAQTGTILSFNGNLDAAKWFDTPTITQSQAQQMAQTLVSKLAPSTAADMTLVSDSALSKVSNAFAFQFSRTVNGIPAPFDGAQLTIGPDGSLVSYQYSWHDVTFPSATATVSPASADTAYRNSLGLHLEYITTYGPGNGAGSMMLSYLSSQGGGVYFNPFNTSGPWIDASSANALNANGQPISAPSSTAAYTPLVPGGPAQVPAPLATPLDQNGAEAAARKALNLPSSTKLVSANSGGYSAPGGISGTTWSLSFQDSGSTSQFQVSIDADNGLFSDYHTFPMQPTGISTQASSIDNSQAQQVAEDFVKQAYPTLTGMIALDPTVTNPPGSSMYNENFVFLENGVPVQSNISVQVDGSGKVQNVFFSPWALQATYPSAANAIPLNQAVDDYVKEAPLQLAYELPSTQVATPQGTQVSYGKQAILVYAPNWGSTIGQLNATSGEWISLNSQSGSVPTDVQGHAGADEMTILSEHGSLPVTDGKVNPDAVVTRAQFVSWLVKAGNMYFGASGGDQSQDFTDVPTSNQYYGDIQQAVTQGWLSPGGAFNPDQPITRSDAASLIVHWLGWTNIASKSTVFVNPFSDAAQIPSDELGDAIIAAQLGMIPAINGAFLPNNNMNVADASIAIVHAFRVANGEN